MNQSEISTEKQKSLSNQVKQTLSRSKNCAQTSFSVLQQEFKLDGEEILRALTPFPGLALRGETCGAVSGCLMAIGLVYGREDLGDWKGYLASLPPARRFCRRFEEVNGSLKCTELLQVKMGRAYDLADRTEALKYAIAGGQKVCQGIISNAVLIAWEILAKKTNPVPQD